MDNIFGGKNMELYNKETLKALKESVDDSTYYLPNNGFTLTTKEQAWANLRTTPTTFMTKQFFLGKVITPLWVMTGPTVLPALGTIWL